MKGLDEFLLPYIISQFASLIFLIVAWKKPKWARILFALLFFWAAATNMYYGLHSPVIYQQYAYLALPFYRDFINGWFSHYSYILVPMIAVGQFFIALGMLLKGWWVKAACLGAILFLLSIVPLMVGAGFPFSITVSVAAFIIFKKDKKEYSWKNKS